MELGHRTSDNDGADEQHVSSSGWSWLFSTDDEVEPTPGAFSRPSPEASASPRVWPTASSLFPQRLLSGPMQHAAFAADPALLAALHVTLLPAAGYTGFAPITAEQLTALRGSARSGADAHVESTVIRGGKAQVTAEGQVHLHGAGGTALTLADAGELHPTIVMDATAFEPYVLTASNVRVQGIGFLKSKASCPAASTAASCSEQLRPQMCEADTLTTYDPHSSIRVSQVDEVVVISMMGGNTVSGFLLQALPRLVPLLPWLRSEVGKRVRIHVHPGYAGYEYKHLEFRTRVNQLLEVLGVSRNRVTSGHIDAKVAYLPDGNPCHTLLAGPLLAMRAALLEGIAAKVTAAPRAVAGVPWASEPAPSSVRVLLLRRRKGGIIRNHAELVTTLRSMPHVELFELDDRANFPHQAAVLHSFSRARVIIGSHGAGLSNAVTAAPGTLMIELHCSRTASMRYAQLASVVGLQYHGFMESDCEAPGMPLVANLTAIQHLIQQLSG